MYAEDSSESDVFVDDSESDCPRPSKAALGKKRKRSASSMGDDGESRKSKAAKSLEMDRGRPKTDATGFMVKYGNVMRDCLMRKESRAPRESPKKLWVDTRASSQHPCVRRAGLSDMGPYAGSSVSSCRTEV